MRQLSLLIALMFYMFTTSAQNKLTIEEAVLLSYENNIELKKQYTKLSIADIAAEESARIPNPIFSYSREDLRFGNIEYNEWTASGTLPLNFLWNRWSLINSKEKEKEVENLLYSRVKKKIETKVRNEYKAIILYSELTSKFNSFLIQLERLAKVTKDRLSEGDISEYEYRRILLEINKIKTVTGEIEIKKEEYYNNFRLLTGLSNNERLQLTPFEYSLELEDDLSNLILTALEIRKDLLAYKIMIESENSNLSYHKTAMIPEMSLTAGYKEQNDNFNGTVFQLNIAIPLFDRNQTNIEKSAIQIDLIQKELQFLKESIKREVSEAYMGFNIKKKNYESTMEANLTEIFSTALFSYEVGEITLVDFIDGMNAYLNGLILQTNLEIEVYLNLFRLEEAVGKEIIKIIE